MNLNHFSVVMCRSTGLILLLFGLSYLLPLLIYGPSPVPRSGWTSYAPLAHNDSSPALSIPLSAIVRPYIPAITQLVCGLLLLIFSRVIGVILLAKGFLDRDA